MKYVSIDIETTGLDNKRNQIVEIGAVIDELGSDTPIEDLPKFRAVLIHEHMMINAYCANLHRDLWQEIKVAEKLISTRTDLTTGYFSRKRNSIGCEGDCIKDEPVPILTHYMYPKMFESVFHNWLCKQFNLPRKEDHTFFSPSIKINVAGKNPGTFDVPFIEALPEWKGIVEFHRRVLDPASHYVWDRDEHIPDLQECLRRAGIDTTVSHTAVDDAIDIVKLVRCADIGDRIV